jgi:hypothetical protein
MIVHCDTAPGFVELKASRMLTIAPSAEPRRPSRSSYGVRMVTEDVPQPLPRVVVAMIWLLAALFNVTLVAFFVLYTNANEQAADRSEATGAFVPSRLLPHAVALWSTAEATIALLIVLDVVCVALFVRGRHRRGAAVR